MHARSFHRRCTCGATVDKLSAGSFLLSGNLLKHELRILPLTKFSVLRDKDDILHFRVKSSVQGKGLGGHILAPDYRLSTLHLSIHSQFLGNVDRRSLRQPGTQAVLIADSLAAELAHGLLRIEAENQLSDRTRHCAVVMLCDRIASLQNRSDEMLPHRFHVWQISKLDEILSGGMDEVASVQSVAARCRLSICHFSRLFKSTYGMPFHKFLIQERIKRAQSQLADSEDPISQVALDCGFADQSCFTRRFTLAIGIPPASWRRQSKRAKVSALMPSVISRTYALEKSVA